MKKQVRNKLRGSAGFTLVELIVVIAIIGILAGVGTVGYGGYIKKANEAADQQLLGAVNQAFAAACLENGVSNRNLNGANLTIGSDSKVQSVHRNNDNINTSFNKYFRANESNAFKVFRSFLYDGVNGVFVGSIVKVESTSNGDGTTTFKVTLSNGKEVTLSANDNDINQVKQATFGTNMTMGELMGSVGAVVDAAGGRDKDTILEFAGDGFEDFLTEIGLNKDEATATQLANALVLKVAKTSSDMDADSIINNYRTDGSFFGDDEDVDLTSQLALMYGVMTGYANSDIGKSANVTVGGQTMTAQEYYAQMSNNLNDPDQVLEMMEVLSEGEGMDNYMDHYARNDISGYISAMNTLSSNTNILVTNTNVLSNGFTDADIVALLNNVFG